MNFDSFDAREVGRTLGHDLFRFRMRADELDLEPAIREGLVQARGQRTPAHAADRFTRKWVQLRLGAYRRHRIVDASVTPELLKSIDIPRCPVTRVDLTHGAMQPTDWSIDRLNNDGAYAISNLAVMSTAANLAKGEFGYEEVFALSQKTQPTRGLLPVEWLRLAAIMLGPCFAARPKLAPVIALAAPIPNQTVHPATQQVQQVFTNAASRPAGKNALIKHFKPACTTERAELRLRSFAETVHLGLKGLDERFDVWLQPGVVDAFVEWRGSLDEPSWALAAEISRRLSGATHLPAGRLRAWHLDSRGHTA